jgi:hypothetical protein
LFAQIPDGVVMIEHRREASANVGRSSLRRGDGVGALAIGASAVGRGSCDHRAARLWHWLVA